jgi:hypothetical protein
MVAKGGANRSTNSPELSLEMAYDSPRPIGSVHAVEANGLVANTATVCLEAHSRLASLVGFSNALFRGTWSGAALTSNLDSAQGRPSSTRNAETWRDG